MYEPGRGGAAAGGPSPADAADLSSVPLIPAAPIFSVFPRPTRSRERLHRRWLLGVGRVYQWAEVALDRLVSPTVNPLYHTGTIAMFSLAVALVTGIYLFLFYRVGTDAAHRSVEGIMAQPWGIGALVRSLHRYASDAAILAAVLHGLKMFLNDRFWGARWIGWVSGLALLALVWVTSATGYWLVWDMQAQVLSLATAKLLDALPVFGEPLVRTFLDAGRIQNFLFFLVLFIHITIPLLLGAAYWLHVMRLSRARFMPPRIVLWVTGAALVVASLLRPALSGPPADLGRLPGVIPIDWFYFLYFPLTRLAPWWGWAIVGTAGLVVLSVPWVLRGRSPARARVENAACTGCTRCWKDCPFEAIVMVPRHDGTRYKQVAVVNPAKCVGCGICVGACDSAGIVLGEDSVSLLGQAVVARLRTLSRGPAADAPVLVYTCRPMQRLAGRLGPDGTLDRLPGVTFMGLPCVGTLHPDMITRTLESGARGVFVAGCVPEDCPYREGSLWLAERIQGQRLPSLKAKVEGRLRVRWYSPVEIGRLVRDVRAFQRDLRSIEPVAQGSAATSEPALQSRRPSAVRLIGFGLLLGAVSWGLGAFAAFPWPGSDPEAAMLRVAFKHVAAFEQRGIVRSKEELEKLPRYMRPTSPELAGTGRRVSTVLRLEVDGQLSLEKSYTPGGLRHDGPTFGYEELPVAPGRHRLRVTLADGRTHGTAEEAARQWQLSQEVDLHGGQALLIEFTEASGLTIRSPALVHRPLD